MNRRFVAADRAPSVAPAAQRCGDILVERIQRVKGRVHRNHGERVIRRAKEEADIEDALQAEIARRMKFHPDAEALVGESFVFDDVIETALRRASEGAPSRPENVPFREWVLSMVDEAIDETVENLAA
jgi:hypothetical protein